jgi:hypothetical protein
MEDGRIGVGSLGSVTADGRDAPGRLVAVTSWGLGCRPVRRRESARPFASTTRSPPLVARRYAFSASLGTRRRCATVVRHSMAVLSGFRR